MKFSLKLFMAVSLMCLCGTALSQTVTTFAPPGSGIDDALLLDSAGNLYGSNYAGSAVYKVSPQGVRTVYMDGFNTPNGIAFDAAGILYVCDNLGDTIYKVTPDSIKIPWVAMNSPSGIIKDPLSDTMIVTRYSPDGVDKIAPDGTVVPFLSGAPLNGSVGLCYDDSLNLYIGNYNDRKVIRVNPDGSMTTIGTIPGSNALGFLVYLRGYLYGTSFGSSRVYRMDMAGNTMLVAGVGYGSADGPALSTARFQRPNGILPSLTGDSLFISDYGTKAVRVLSGVDSIGFVAVSPPRMQRVQLEVGPNPMESSLAYRIMLPDMGEMRLVVLDLLGNEIEVLESGWQNSGEYHGEWAPHGVARGTYILRLEVGTEHQSLKIQYK